MLMKFFSVSALLQTNFFRRSGTPTWVPYTHNIDIIVGACSRYEKFIWFTILTSFDSRYWHHSINQPILIQIHQNHPSLFVFLQEWKALSPLFSSYQQYQPNFEQNTKLDLKDFPLRFCVVSQDPSKKGVSHYSFSLPSNVRALYCQDPMRGEEWKQLISDFDTKLLQWKDWPSFAVFVWWCWCNVYFSCGVICIFLQPARVLWGTSLTSLPEYIASTEFSPQVQHHKCCRGPNRSECACWGGGHPMGEWTIHPSRSSW